MKFIKLESRGGNYLVVASNVAWLRTAENGQTTVGIVGGQPLLVVGSVEEVADKILQGLADSGGEAPIPAAFPAPVTPATSEPTGQAQAAEVGAPEPQPEPELATDAKPAAPADRTSAPARPRAVSARSAAMWERPAKTAPAALKLKSGSQRMMGTLE